MEYKLFCMSYFCTSASETYSFMLTSDDICFAAPAAETTHIVHKYTCSVDVQFFFKVQRCFFNNLRYFLFDFHKIVYTCTKHRNNCSQKVSRDFVQHCMNTVAMKMTRILIKFVRAKSLAEPNEDSIGVCVCIGVWVCSKKQHWKWSGSDSLGKPAECITQFRAQISSLHRFWWRSHCKSLVIFETSFSHSFLWNTNKTFCEKFSWCFIHTHESLWKSNKRSASYKKQRCMYLKKPLYTCMHCTLYVHVRAYVTLFWSE